MSELSQDEKDKHWTELKALHKLRKDSTDQDREKAEKRINEVQKVLGLDITNFGAEKMTAVEKEYTDAQAESQFNEEQLADIEKAVIKAIALKHVIADMVVKYYPKLKNNPAGIGQMVNITYDLIKDKLK